MPTLETDGPELPIGLDLPPCERPGYYKRKRSIDMSLYHSLCVLPVKDHWTFCDIDVLTTVTVEDWP